MFVSFHPDYLDPRGGGTKSKAKTILEYLRDHPKQVFFSKQIVGALADQGIRVADVMANVRRFEREGPAHVRRRPEGACTARANLCDTERLD